MRALWSTASSLTDSFCRPRPAAVCYEQLMLLISRTYFDLKEQTLILPVFLIPSDDPQHPTFVRPNSRHTRILHAIATKRMTGGYLSTAKSIVPSEAGLTGIFLSTEFLSILTLFADFSQSASHMVEHQKDSRQNCPPAYKMSKRDTGK